MHVGLLVGGTINLCLAVILHLIGLATSTWSTGGSDSMNFGIFDKNPSEDAIEGIKAMVILAFLTGCASLVLAIFLIVNLKKCCVEGKVCAILVLVTGIAATIFVLIALILWGTKQHDSDAMCIGYSFSLSCSGGLLFLMGSVTCFVAYWINSK